MTTTNQQEPDMGLELDLKLSLPIMTRGQYAAWLIQFAASGLAQEVDFTTEAGEQALLVGVNTLLHCAAGATANALAFAGLRAEYSVPDKKARAFFHEEAPDIQFTISQEPLDVQTVSTDGISAQPADGAGVDAPAQPGA